MNIWFCVSHHLSCFYSQPTVPALFDIFALCLSVRLSCFSNCPFLCLRPPLSHFLLSRFNGLRPFFFITQVCLLSLHSFQSLMLWIIFCCPRRRDIWKRERERESSLHQSLRVNWSDVRVIAKTCNYFGHWVLLLFYSVHFSEPNDEKVSRGQMSDPVIVTLTFVMKVPGF